MDEVNCFIRALVVLPVQELATQVAKVFQRYCTKTRLKAALLSGSIPLQQEQQKIVKYSKYEVINYHLLYHHHQPIAAHWWT